VLAVIPMDRAEASARLAILLQKLERREPSAYSPKKKSGRPRVWKGRDGYLLMIAVNSIKAERGKGIADAVRSLRMRSDRWRPFPARELEIRFQEACKFWVPMAKSIAEVQALADELNAIESAFPPASDVFSLIHGYVTKNRKDFS
jgi:hypothetical protein